MNLFYTNTLYPLQDKVLQIISSLNTGFYLTGGTALSRFYYGVRFSDDLDFFIQNEPQFINLTEKIINAIKLKHEIEIDAKADSFVRVTVEKILKVDFVNDVGEHFGNFKKTDFFEKIDSTKNILANKLTAILARDEAKDVVDLWTIATNEKINWPEIFRNSSSKAVGIFPPAIAERIRTFPTELLDKIKWIDEKNYQKKKFERDIEKIIEDMLEIEK